MTTSIRPNLENYYSVTQQHQDNPSPYCTLQWRRGQLLVKPLGQMKQLYLPSLDRKQSLVECLKRSTVTLVRIDPKLGEAKLRLWADACEQANKTIFLRIPSIYKQPQSENSLRWLKRLTDWITALVFLLAVSPIMLGLVLLMRVYSPESLFSHQWHVGERGRLFKVMKFRTTVSDKKTLEDKAINYQSGLSTREDEQNITPLGRWMHKYGLDNLPQLLNVVRGEMSLTGTRCLTLEEAVRLSPEEQRQLNKLPGITGTWVVEAESNLLHLDSQTM